MKIGTKSVLFGAHCFMIHWFFVAVAWWKLYGFPWDPRLWFAFFLHDLGYWGKPNMDGDEGECHPFFAAELMHRLFDRGESWHWYALCLYHSRFLAKRHCAPFSNLCVADKLSIVLTPAWLYLPMVRLTGEIREYMALAQARTKAGEPKYASARFTTSSQERWYFDVQEYLRRWVAEHRDGRKDTWTPDVVE